jgi:hypothetical protein
MRPPKKENTFEKLACGDFIKGFIEDINYDETHTFKGFEGKPDSQSLGIRFVFRFEGYEYPHRSRWMKFNVGEKANLYKKYISKLVNNTKPDIDFDLDLLKGMPVKTVWEQNGDFQNLELIAPLKNKLTIPENEANEPPVVVEEDDFAPELSDDDVPL